MTSSNPPGSTQSEQPMRYGEAEFEALTRELAERELELATLENELSVFEKRYVKTVGILFAELDALEKEIAREMLRLHPEEAYREGFRRAEKKSQASQDAVNEKTKQDEKQTYIPTEEIKNLYRKVAKAIHPDLSVSEEERAFRTRLMARANAAYKTGDKQALEQILYEWEHRDEKTMFREEKIIGLDLLERKILQIKARLKEIERKVGELKQSELYQLMKKVEQADREKRDLLGDMAKDLREKVLYAKQFLESLKDQERG
jgi:hypothetical protein